MKTLFLVRHAKSSWGYPQLSDFDRPLGHRGVRDAPRMGAYLKEMGVAPNVLLSSPAKRAYDTALVIAASIGHDHQILTDRRIYHAGCATLLEVLKETHERHDSLMMFGHNPGFTDFANELANEEIVNLPTCGACQIDFRIDNWNEIVFGGGGMIFFQYPKGLS